MHVCSSKRKENIQETSNHQQTAGAEGGREGGREGERKRRREKEDYHLKPAGLSKRPLPSSSLWVFAFTFMKKEAQ